MNIDKSVFAAEGARITGDNITIGAGSSVWYNTVIRCDEDESVTIGTDTNIQDLCMVHTSPGVSTTVGSGCTIGHCSIIHACTIGDGSLIGMGSIVMDEAVIGSNCIIGAGSLVTKGQVIPDGKVAFGRPAKIVRDVTDADIALIRGSMEGYRDKAAERVKGQPAGQRR